MQGFFKPILSSVLLFAFAACTQLPKGVENEHVVYLFGATILPDGKKVFHRGGGVTIYNDDRGESFILTARHLTKNLERVFIDTFHGRQLTGKVLWEHPDPEVDLALVSVPGNLSPALLQICEGLTTNDRVVSISHPGDLQWSIGEGIVLEEKPFFIRTNSYAWFGSSGGGLFNKTKGQLAGVIVAIEPYNAVWTTRAISLIKNISDINQVLPVMLSCEK